MQHVRGMDAICRLQPGLPEKVQFLEGQRRPQANNGRRPPRHAELFIAVMQKTAGTLAGLKY
ncbi:MAG: hypothetical protein WKG07_37880 [Hymenobacter sp.]